MVEFQLTPDWRITSDERNYILQRRQVVGNARKEENAGREYWVNEGYWYKLEQLLAELPDRHLKPSDCRGLEAAVQHIQRLRDDIRHAVLLVLPERPGDPAPGVQKQMTISA